MAEALSGVTGSLQGSLQGTINGLTNTAMSWLDKIVPPELREKVLAWISKFAAERPQLASFLASHIALSGPAIGLFIVITVSISIFALLVAIILALLGTVLFIVTVAGFSLIFLFPVLFVTTGVATFLWLWGMAVYYLLKHFNKTDIPGIHTGLGEGLSKEAQDYGERGRKEGYGVEYGNIGEDRERKIEGGKQSRKEIEDKYSGKDGGKDGGKENGSAGKEGKVGEGASGHASGVAEKAGDVKKRGQDAHKEGGKHVGKAVDGVNGVAGKTPAGGATKGVTDGLKGITG